MGDRGNCVIESGEGQVFLYTHWAGSELPNTVAAALARGVDRWTDDSYLARIIFCEMVAGEERETTGFGISAYMGDGGTEVYVYPSKGVIEYAGNTYTFPEFVDTYLGG